MGNNGSREKQNEFYEQWVDNLPSLIGKVVAISGTTSGTGYWTAVCAVRKQATAVILLNRSSKRNEESLERLQKENIDHGNQTKLIPVVCDMMSFESVRLAAEEINRFCVKYGGLNILANNAGIMSFPDDRTADGFEVQMQVNHLSPFLLSKLLLPSFNLSLSNNGEVRIVQHSSGARNGGGDLKEQFFKRSSKGKLGGNSLSQCFNRYHMSKLAMSSLGVKLDKELKLHGYDTTKFKSIVADPGSAATAGGSNRNLAHANHNTGLMFKLAASLFDFLISFVPQQSAADGALPLIEACFGIDVQSGDLFYPENVYIGKPYKGISQGHLVANAKGGKDKLTLSEKNQNLVWAASQDAIGTQFF